MTAPEPYEYLVETAWVPNRAKPRWELIDRAVAELAQFHRDGHPFTFYDVRWWYGAGKWETLLIYDGLYDAVGLEAPAEARRAVAGTLAEVNNASNKNVKRVAS